MTKSVKATVYVILSVALVFGLSMMMFAGCSGTKEDPAAGGNSVVVNKAAFTGSANGCANGGISVEAGIDKNGNGVLDKDEVSSTQYVCNGTNGAAGADGAKGDKGDTGTSVKGDKGDNGVSVTLTKLSVGDTNCPLGGTKVSVAGGTPPDAYVCNATVEASQVKVARTAVEAFRDLNYTFIHGTNNPAGDKLFVVVNETNAGQGGTTSGMSGNFTGYLLKMADVEAGKVTSSSIITKNTITGVSTGAATIAFRQSYTPDGTKIVQAGKDRVVVLKASDLKPLGNYNGDTNIGGGSASFENHDALAIDNNYALLALQSKMSTTWTGVASLVLYDLNANAAIGGAVNMCDTCHSSQDPAGKTGGPSKSHFMCGIDGKLTMTPASGGTPTTYTGNIYVSSTGGGHLVKVPVTIDPSNTTTPIVVGAQSTIQLTVAGPPASSDMPNYHDVRYDAAAKRVYYSAIKTGSNGRAMLGYVTLNDNGTFNTVIRATIGVTGPANTGLVYCGSGQSANSFIPMTMSYPAYIDSIKKTEITDDAELDPLP